MGAIVRRANSTAGGVGQFPGLRHVKVSFVGESDIENTNVYMSRDVYRTRS